MRNLFGPITVIIAIIIVSYSYVRASYETVIIGFNIPLTGDNPDMGASSKNAAEMYLMKHPTITIGGKRYALKFLYQDNEYKAESAVKASAKLITEDEVIGIIGPQSSSQAVPAGEVANRYATPMISPWSTHPHTTLNRPYVFRASFLNSIQATIMAKFATEEFGARKAAVLYDATSSYPTELGNIFKNAFEEIHGTGSVVAFETFATGDKDFSAQMSRIMMSGADVLFVPQFDSEVPIIIRTAKSMGWNKPILGSDSWGSDRLMELCGEDCKGYYFSTNFTAFGMKGKAKDFIDAYTATYGKTPDDVAALTWDSIDLMIQALKKIGGLTGDISSDRVRLKDALTGIRDFHGITGSMVFSPDGNPRKCAVMVKINDNGVFSFYKSVCCPACKEDPICCRYKNCSDMSICK